MMPTPTEIKDTEAQIKTRIYLEMILSFACGFIASGILLKFGVILV